MTPEVDEKRSRGLVEAELQEPGQPAMRTVSLTPHKKADIIRLMTFTATIDARIAGRRRRPPRRSAGGVVAVVAVDQRDRDREDRTP